MAPNPVASAPSTADVRAATTNAQRADLRRRLDEAADVIADGLLDLILRDRRGHRVEGTNLTRGGRKNV